MDRLAVLCHVVPVAVVLVWSLAKVDSCSLEWAELDIEHPGCFPRRLLVKGCRGTCSSYTRPSQMNPGQLERFCQCCDVDSMRLRRAILFCPNTETNPPQLRRMAVTMKIPQSCRCRPCTETPEHVIPAEEEFLQNGKRSYDFNPTNHSDKTPPGRNTGNIFTKAITNENKANKLHLNKLLKMDVPFIFVQDHSLNFSVHDVN